MKTLYDKLSDEKKANLTSFLSKNPEVGKRVYDILNSKRYFIDLTVLEAHIICADWLKERMTIEFLETLFNE